MSHIFISYSRRDLDIAGRIVQALAESKLDVWVDWQSIPKGEDWEQEIQRGIEGADAFLFLISPDSVASPMCNREIAHAVRNGKRILPIFVANVDNRQVYGVTDKFVDPVQKEEINRRNFIFCREGRDDFGKAMEEVLKTIHTDYGWLQYHTDLQVKALKWDHQKDISRLLRGKELREAEYQLTDPGGRKDPRPTQLQRQYILASQHNEIRTRRQIMGGLAAGLAIMVVLAVIAWGQRNSAVTEANGRATAQSLAEQNAKTAVAAQDRAEEQRNVAVARQLAVQSGSALQNHPQQAVLLSLLAGQVSPLESTAIQQVIHDSLTDFGGTPFVYHSGEILAVEFSPNGRWVATGGRDKTLKLTDLENLENVAPASAAGDEEIHRIAFSPDGRWLAAGGVGEIVRLWDMKDRDKAPLQLRGCSGEIIYEFQFSPDGKWLVLQGSDYFLCLIRTDDLLKSRIQLSGSGNNFDHFAFSRDGNWLAAGVGTGRILLWKLKPLDEEAVALDKNWGIMSSLVFSPDNAWLASGDNDPGANTGVVNIWGMDDLQAEPKVLTYPDPVRNIFFQADGGLLVAREQSGVARVDASSGTFEETVLLDASRLNVQVGDMAPGGERWLAAITGDQIILQDLHFKVGVPMLLRGHEGQVYDIAISPDGEMLASVGVDGIGRLWKTSSPAIEPVRLNSYFQTYAIDPAGAKLIYSNADAQFISYDIESAAGIPLTAREPIWLMDARYSPDGKRIAALDGRVIHLWDANDPGGGPTRLNVDGDYIDQFTFNADSTKILALKGRRSIVAWDLTTSPAEETVVVTCPEDISTFALSRNDTWLAFFCKSSIALIDLRKLELSDLSMESGYIFPEEGYIVFIKFSADEHWMLTSEYYGTDKLWNLHDLTEEPDVFAYTFADDFSPDGRRLLIGSHDGKVQLVDLQDRELSINVPWQETLIRATAFSADGKWLASAGEDSSTKLFASGDFTAPLTFNAQRGMISDIAFTRDGNWLLLTDYFGSGITLQIWGLGPQWLSEAACRSVGRNLTRTEWIQYVGDLLPYRAICPDLPIEPEIIFTPTP
jgi:WD40 repeat protein